MAAGKHVLCEKPFTANAEEPVPWPAPTRFGPRSHEAFHYRYHPLFARVLALIESGTVGTVRHIQAALCFPLLSARTSAGTRPCRRGHHGCRLLSHPHGPSLAGSEPEVTAAAARLRSPGSTAT